MTVEIVYTDLGCWWVNWARGRGRVWGCWGSGSAEDSWRSLGCWGRRLGRPSWWGSGAPSHPGNLREDPGGGGHTHEMNRSAVVLSKRRAIFQANHTLHEGPQKIILVFQLFNWNSITLPSTRQQMRGRISYISTRSRMQKHISRVSSYPIKPCYWEHQQCGAWCLYPNTVYENRKKQVCGFNKGLVWLQE